MAVVKGLRETISVFKKIIFSSCHMEEKTFIEASHTFKILTGENVFATATFKDFWVLFTSERVKKYSMLWYVWVLCTFKENKRRNKYCLWEVNFAFYMYKFSPTYQSVHLFRKNRGWKYSLHLCLFLWQTQKLFFVTTVEILLSFFVTTVEMRVNRISLNFSHDFMFLFLTLISQY